MFMIRKRTRARRSSVAVWSRSFRALCFEGVEDSSWDSRDDGLRRRTVARGRRRGRCGLGRPCPGVWAIAIRRYPCGGCRCHCRLVLDLGALAVRGLKVDHIR